MIKKNRDSQYIILSSPADAVHALQTVIQLNPGKSVTWVYLGKSYSLIKQCRKDFVNKACEIEIHNDLDDISKKSEADYISSIEKLNEINKNNLVWWFTPVSTRCPLISDVFQNLCYIRLVENLFTEDRIPSIIIIESSGLLCIIDQLLTNSGFDTSFPSHSERKKKKSFRLVCKIFFQDNYHTLFIAIKKSLLAPMVEICDIITRAYKRRFASSLTKRDIDPVLINKKTIMIITFFFQDDINDGKFVDRYHPYLYDYLKSKGYDILIYPRFCQEIINPELYEKIRSNPDAILIPEDYLSIFDYFKAFFKCITGKYRLKIKFDSNDPLYILEDYIIDEVHSITTTNILRNYLTYFAFRNIMKEGQNIQSIILWHENQYDERGIIRAVREMSPDTPISGYQGFIHYTNYLNIMPVQSEVHAGITPDRFLITGKSQINFITKYTKDQKFSIAAALRYNYIYRENNKYFNTISHSRECIVIILPGMEQAIEIVDMVFSLSQEGHFSLPVYIKDHPNCSYESLEKNLIIENFLKYTGKVVDLPYMFPIIITGTSSVVIETLCMGIPTIFLGRSNTLNFDPVNQEIPHYYRCNSAYEIISTINGIINLKDNNIEERLKITQKIKDEFFTPISDESMRTFIEDIKYYNF